VRVFVGCKPDSDEAVGFYSLVLTALVPEDVSEVAREKFERVQAVPAIYLAMIGVHTDYQGRTIGEQLMRDAFSRGLLISEHAGAYAISLDALNEKVAEYYKALSFEPFTEGNLKMFLPLSLLRTSQT